MEDTRSAGQKYMDAWLEKHPNVKGVLDVIAAILNFFFGGHVFVWLVNKLIRTAGRIAESVLMLGTLWITSELVAGKELNVWIGSWPVPNALGIPTQLTTLCVMAFSLIPEIILLSAIVTTFKHWWITFHQKTKVMRVGRGVWAVLYTLPTIAFIVLVYITFQKLTSVTDLANLAKLAQAGTDTIQARVLAGWFFSMIELIYPLIMKAMRDLESEYTEKQNTSAHAEVKGLSLAEVESLILEANKASDERNEKHFTELSLQNERHIESLNQQLKDTLTTIKKTVSVTLEQTTLQRDNGSTQHILKAGKRASQQLEQKSETLSFDRKLFVYECLLHDATMSTTAIQLKAEHEQKKLSIGTISNYRKAFFNDHSELSMKAEQDTSLPEIESSIESLQDFQDADDVVIIEAL